MLLERWRTWWKGPDHASHFKPFTCPVPLDVHPARLTDARVSSCLPVGAQIDPSGQLYVEDWDINEGEVAAMTRLIQNCTSDDTEA
jgi:hypothetical protein